MIHITASIEFWGESFSPRDAADKTGLSFADSNEPGDIGKVGKYRDKPTPYGSASLVPPKEVPWHDRILWLANALSDKTETLRACGAGDMKFWVAYYHDGQCNCELTTEELTAISSTGITFCFSVYEEDNLEGLE